MSGRYYVGEWLVEPEQGRLVRGSETTKLDPKAVQVLSFLAKHPNEILTKDEIISSVWDGAFVSDEVLTTAVWGLRKALGDDAKEPRYIQTIPRRGYRFIAPVEGVTSESSGRWEPSPYPGLSAFSQRDAQYFFGREQEVETLWKKIHEKDLLGLIGPSGAGKSSLLRAGLIPAAPEGWDIVLCQPRAAAFDRLSASIDVRGRTLWVVDQFEELFTLHDEDMQGRFAELLGRAAGSGIHVLLSMRDDFLIRCHAHPALAPVFVDLTPVLPLSGAALRKALVEPARASGYRFEDEALVAEILTEVSRERGALPLLAFAASKLWEKRDREKYLLTREAYLAIGGVAGALANHAEATISSIGVEREPIVRKIFRNLTTASGTRVPIDQEELLTVFPGRAEAAGVLGNLIDARLLTAAGHEVEVIHESLLSAWPRLVRWQAEDAAGAVLRDQLRQAARTWQERGRPEDLLWTGTSYRELALWRERYGGGLPATEEGFAEAATELAGRRRRRRRAAVIMGFAVLLAVIGAVTSLWRRSVLEVSRREAAQILALGRVNLAERPTAALAHALASLERADSEEARQFAVEALWHGAAATVLPGNMNTADFSPDGKWLVTGGFESGVKLWSRDGGPPRTLGGPDPNGNFSVQFNPDGNVLAAGGETARFWSIPEGTEIHTFDLHGRTSFRRRGHRLLSTSETSERTVAVRDWNVFDRDPGVLATFDRTDLSAWDFDSSGEWFLSGRGNGVYVSPLRDPSPNRSRLVGRHGAKVVRIAPDPSGPRIISGDETREIRIWNFSESSAHLERTFRGATVANALMDPTGSWLTVSGVFSSPPGTKYVWDLKGPPDAEPLLLRNRDLTDTTGQALHPAGLWLFEADNHDGGVLWPLHPRFPRVLRPRSPGSVAAIAFTPDGKSLVSTSNEGGVVELWPLSSGGGARRVLKEDKNEWVGHFLDIDPRGRFALLAAHYVPRVYLLPLEGGAARQMPGFTDGHGWAMQVAFSPDGRLALNGSSRPAFLRIWDIETDELQTLDLKGDGQHCWGDVENAVLDLKFLSNRRVLLSDAWGIRLFDLEDGSRQQIRPCKAREVSSILAVDRNRGRFLILDMNDVERVSTIHLYELESKTFREITSHGNRVQAVALDPTGQILVTGDMDGVVRVGPISGEEPHLLFGDPLAIWAVAVSPDSRWIAASSLDGTIRLWPLPPLSEATPFHTLPYQEILTRLRALTNLRVVPNEKSGSGYKIEIGPFPGWKNFPEW